MPTKDEITWRLFEMLDYYCDLGVMSEEEHEEYHDLLFAFAAQCGIEVKEGE